MVAEEFYTHIIPHLSSGKARVTLFVYYFVIFDSSAVTCFNTLSVVFYIFYFIISSLLVKSSNS